MKKIALLGSTGSIGVQVLGVVSRYPELFSIVSLSAGSNAELFREQVKAFRPKVATLKDASAFSRVKENLPTTTTYAVGEDSVLSAIVEEADIVVVAVVGFAGLQCVLKAIEMGKPIALANKESLCCGGELVTRLAKEKNVPIYPVDSEHSAIWQCLDFDKTRECVSLTLTASGGPFWRLTKEEIAGVTKAQALKHPTWNMGAKITIDSATLANKGLEVMEARYLFDIPEDRIEVVIHPESIVHSAVNFADGVTMAQMSYPNMEIPIQLALTAPSRIPTTVKKLDLATLSQLTFYPVPEEKFPCFHLARQALKAGGVLPCAYSVANEAAVFAFLREEIRFSQIPYYISLAMDKISNERADTYQTLLSVKTEAERIVTAAIRGQLCK
ncbi:MAG: 1-deoxy-D-xylulose-5-phosphate reductoisomerase [Clostridiales bacterium]|nr:1-deoxy-D-xylulose-5-phosphate reductoisomerase [Clostridiales bacterium]